MIRPRLREVTLAVVSTLVAAAVGLAIFGWYQGHRDPVAAGKDLNRLAWESAFVERGLAVPPSGPRNGYWGALLPPKVPDARVGWHEASVSVPGRVEVDAQGYQHDTTAAPGKRHVVVFGGSVAFGGYASSLDTTYFHVLGRELERAGTPADVTVVASGAWKAIQELNALAAFGPELKPDVVVFLDGLNDLTSGATARTLFGEVTPTRDGSPWTSEYHAHDYADRVTAYLGIMGKAAELSAQLGSGMLVVLQPSLAERSRRTPIEERLLEGSLRPHASAEALTQSYEAMRRGLAARAATGAFRFLDCSRLFDVDAQTSFADLWHFGDPGQVLLGRAIASEVAAMLAARPPR